MKIMLKFHVIAIRSKSVKVGLKIFEFVGQAFIKNQNFFTNKKMFDFFKNKK